MERYRDKKRRRLFSGAKTIRYEKRKVNADRRYVQSAEVHVVAGTILDMKQFAHPQFAPWKATALSALLASIALLLTSIRELVDGENQLGKSILSSV